MATVDGHKATVSSCDGGGMKVKMVTCTRWEEIADSASVIADHAGILGASTTFRFLNDPGVRTSPPGKGSKKEAAAAE
jgi:hypothetical protein